MLIYSSAYVLGWDKTFALNHIESEGFEEIHFFGDKVSHDYSAWIRIIVLCSSLLLLCRI
jgi:hypothetical protein